MNFDIAEVVAVKYFTVNYEYLMVIHIYSDVEEESFTGFK